MIDPLQGEVWWVDLEPAVGSEAKKSRPCIVVGSPAFNRIGLRLVVPLTTWKTYFVAHPNKIKVTHALENGLDFDSAADGLQLRSVSIERFRYRSGAVSSEDQVELRHLLALVFGLELPRDEQ